MGRTGTFTDKLLKMGCLLPDVTPVTFACPNLPQTGKLSHRPLLSFKLHSIIELSVHMARCDEWQWRCERDGPTTEGGHHEQRRRNNPHQRTFDRIVLCFADAAGDQYLRAARSRSSWRSAVLDQIGCSRVPGVLSFFPGRISPQ